MSGTSYEMKNFFLALIKDVAIMEEVFAREVRAGQAQTMHPATFLLLVILSS
jgi:hypothetical protein